MCKTLKQTLTGKGIATAFVVLFGVGSLMAETTNLFSPTVCYQYAEGIAIPPTVTYQYNDPAVFSPVECYHYDEGVGFSPIVSHYYQFVIDSVGDGIPDLWRAQYFGGYGTTTNALSTATGDAS